MKRLDWDLGYAKWRGLLATDRPEPVQQAERIVKVLRDVVLPAKAGVCLVVLYYLFNSGWLGDEQTARSVALDTLKKYFVTYAVCNTVGAVFLVLWRRLPPVLVQWIAFVLGLLDGLFMAGVTVFTGGFTSIAFWVFPGLIVLNALSIPLATPQIFLNLLLSVFYAGAVILTPELGFTDVLTETQMLANMNARGPAQSQTEMRGTNQISHSQAELLARLKRAATRSSAALEDPDDETVTTDRLLLRAAVLWLLTLCCYGTQVLLERQRHAVQEAAEFAAREGQLHSAGRVAAEFAHQIKNPLAVINNAAYSLQRSLTQEPSAARSQLEIIREEVARADKAITQIMGYAQLSEGRVERLKVGEEVSRAVAQVFPAAVPMGVAFHQTLTGPFPALLMQRNHLGDILVNLLQNAREAAAAVANGKVTLIATCDSELTVSFTVADNGQGIAPDKLERVFEAYYTTKEKGTGLGLAIVKHNAELYGGQVRVESVLGQGAKFKVTFPAKSLPKPFAK